LRDGIGFGKARRIRKRAEFQRVQAAAGRVTSAHFVLLVAARTEGGPSRLGLVVTKKVGNAVQRNRIKRVCRACFRTWNDLVPEGVDLVVIAREGAAELGLAAVRDEWARVQGQLRRKAAEALARRPEATHVSPRAGPRTAGAKKS
jgi:ribonuclease P protein component